VYGIGDTTKSQLGNGVTSEGMNINTISIIKITSLPKIEKIFAANTTSLAVRFNEKNNYFSKNNKQIVGSNCFSDVKFQIQGTIIHAHKVILAYRCSVLFKMFLEQPIRDIFEIDSIQKEEFLKILEYLYTDSIPTLTEEEKKKQL